MKFDCLRKRVPRSLIFSSCSTLPSTTPTPHTFPLPPPPPTPNPRLYLTSPEVFETFDFPRLKRVLFASGYWLSISADRSAREGELGLLVAMISWAGEFQFYAMCMVLWAAKFKQTFPTGPQGKPSDIKEEASVQPPTYLFDYRFVSPSIEQFRG